jgi:nicotinamidase-related amidase
MQTAFLEPGSAMEIAGARDIVPAVNRISRALRTAGGLVVFVQHRVDKADLVEWSVYYDGIARIFGMERPRCAVRRFGGAESAFWRANAVFVGP